MIASTKQYSKCQYTLLVNRLSKYQRDCYALHYEKSIVWYFDFYPIILKEDGVYGSCLSLFHFAANNIINTVLNHLKLTLETNVENHVCMYVILNMLRGNLLVVLSETIAEPKTFTKEENNLNLKSVINLFSVILLCILKSFMRVFITYSVRLIAL